MDVDIRITWEVIKSLRGSVGGPAPVTPRQAEKPGPPACEDRHPDVTSEHKRFKLETQMQTQGSRLFLSRRHSKLN